jgi:ribose/xylose/arabinose/galactoside ABC-type transport system permease subunit
MQEAIILFLKNLANLFKVKTILSLLVITTTCILTFKNIVSVEAFMAIASAIITYYFTRKDESGV